MSAAWARLRRVVPHALAVALIAAAAVWLAANWQKVSAALTLSPAHLALLVPMVVVSVLLVGLMNQVMASHLGAPLRFKQWAFLAFASTLANYILPMRAGAAMRAAYYKRCHRLPVTRFASSMAVAYVMVLLTNSLAGLAAILWIGLGGAAVSWPLAWAFGGVAAACAAVLVFSPKASRRQSQSRPWQALVRIHDGWDELRRSRTLLAKAAGLSVATTLIYALRLRVAFAAIGHEASLPGCLLIGALVALSMFITITPAALGIREAAILFSSMALGITPEISLLAGAVDRAVAILVVAAVGPVAMISISHETAGTPRRQD